MASVGDEETYLQSMMNRPPSVPPTDAPAQFGSKRIMDMNTLSEHIKNALARSNHIGETLEPLHMKPPNQSGHQYRKPVDPHKKYSSSLMFEESQKKKLEKYITVKTIREWNPDYKGPRVE